MRKLHLIKKNRGGSAPKVNEFPTEAGSISIESFYLWLLSKYFAPRNVLEVGTYIGRSTLALAFGGRESIEQLILVMALSTVWILIL